MLRAGKAPATRLELRNRSLWTEDREEANRNLVARIWASSGVVSSGRRTLSRPDVNHLPGRCRNCCSTSLEGGFGIGGRSFLLLVAEVVICR